MYKERLLTQRIIRLAETFPVTVVSGARQVGKTTLLQHLFPGYDYVVFDPSIDLENARKDPDLFLRNHPPPVILDEIQYAPEVVAAVKRHVDRAGAAPGQFLLTGSQQWQVLRTLSESLAGRAAFLDLQGLSLQERAGAATGWLTRWLEEPAGFFQWSREADYGADHLNEWLWRGTLPGLLRVDDDLVADFWAGYHRTYVERDARMLGEVADWQEFGRFYGLLCSLTAQAINFSQLGREIGMTPQTARRWLSILEATFQWFSLPAFSGNAVKRVASRPKGHIAEDAQTGGHPGGATGLVSLADRRRRRGGPDPRTGRTALSLRVQTDHQARQARRLRAARLQGHLSRAGDRTRRAGLRRDPAALGDGRGAGHPVESAVNGRGGPVGANFISPRQPGAQVGDRSPAPAWARGPGRAATIGRRVSRAWPAPTEKIPAFSGCFWALIAPPSPVPAEMPATCGRSGPCPRSNRIKSTSRSRRISRAWPAPTEKSGVFGMFLGVGRALTPRSRRNARHLR
jgi:hypothetical protein